MPGGRGEGDSEEAVQLRERDLARERGLRATQVDGGDEKSDSVVSVRVRDCKGY